jgi:uncharacterized membrane protein
VCYRDDIECNLYGNTTSCNGIMLIDPYHVLIGYLFICLLNTAELYDLYHTHAYLLSLFAHTIATY